MAAYLDLVGQTKDVRLQGLLQKTDACLQSLCQRLVPKAAAKAEPQSAGHHRSLMTLRQDLHAWHPIFACVSLWLLRAVMPAVQPCWLDDKLQAPCRLCSGAKCPHAVLTLLMQQHETAKMEEMSSTPLGRSTGGGLQAERHRSSRTKLSGVRWHFTARAGRCSSLPCSREPCIPISCRSAASRAAVLLTAMYILCGAPGLLLQAMHASLSDSRVQSCIGAAFVGCTLPSSAMNKAVHATYFVKA